MACELPPPGGGGKRGKTTKVFFPLLTPQTFLRTRLPSVARLKSGGPQGRLVLQGSTLDGSGAFRSDGVCALHRMAAHCYARRFTQGKFRAVKHPIACPTHGTEPPQPPFRCATEGSRGAKEGLGCQEGKGNHRCPVPSCLRRESPAFLRRGHGASRPPKAATVHAHSERKVAFSGAPLYRRKYTLC